MHVVVSTTRADPHQLLPWLAHLGLTGAHVYVYHRTPDPDGDLAAELAAAAGQLACGMRLHVAPLLPNKGRESAVYLHHLVTHYDALPQVFLLAHDHGPASWHSLCGPFLRRARAYCRGAALEAAGGAGKGEGEGEVKGQGEEEDVEREGGRGAAKGEGHGEEEGAEIEAEEGARAGEAGDRGGQQGDDGARVGEEEEEGQEEGEDEGEGQEGSGFEAGEQRAEGKEDGANGWRSSRKLIGRRLVRSAAATVAKPAAGAYEDGAEGAAAVPSPARAHAHGHGGRHASKPVASLTRGEADALKRFADMAVTLSSGCVEPWMQGCCGTFMCSRNAAPWCPFDSRDDSCALRADLAAAANDIEDGGGLHHHGQYDVRYENVAVPGPYGMAITSYGAVPLGPANGTAPQSDYPANAHSREHDRTGQALKEILERHQVPASAFQSCCAMLLLRGRHVGRWPRRLYEELLEVAMSPDLDYFASKTVEFTGFRLWAPGGYTAQQVLDYLRVDRLYRHVHGCPAPQPGPQPGTL
ncbi:hypothetical protein HYH03_003517 [Edaphochlamys debaryana]|uniref:Uncharacterized protein n=1 Tax=Edaphochlamys debaryana TaxID=47281 RepID=A0A836C4D1_9CHLO|nr:hypothetical protein HYH03_003517 [Edaphochlamys debaryana]|eukprot:KAG2498778.1 hypothetical protein HYH03_003517 [Edaphochlamys debaryana]